MKWIINGKKYDTATAKVVEQWSSTDRYGYAYNLTDNRYDTVILFKKRNGEYFLYRECAFGEKIKPIDSDEANRLADLEFSYDPEWNTSLAVNISDAFGYFGEWKDSMTYTVEKVLVDLHNSGECFDEIDVAELAEKVADNNADLKINDFIKAWAFAYRFEDYFDSRKNYSVEEVAQDFVEGDILCSNHLDMLENEDYEQFMVDIMGACGMCDGSEMSLNYYLGREEAE